MEQETRRRRKFANERQSLERVGLLEGSSSGSVGHLATSSSSRTQLAKAQPSAPRPLPKASRPNAVPNPQPKNAGPPSPQAAMAAAFETLPQVRDSLHQSVRTLPSRARKPLRGDTLASLSPPSTSPTQAIPSCQGSVPKATPSLQMTKDKPAPASAVLEDPKVKTLEEELYMVFLRFLFFAFTIWSCLHLVFLYLAMNEGVAGALATTTAFNLGRNTNADRLWRILFLRDVSTTSLYRMLNILDSLGLLIFFLFNAVFFYVVLPLKLNFFYRDKLNAGKLAVEISGLPRRLSDHGDYEKQLTRHLCHVIREERRRRGMADDPNPDLIHECHLVRDYGGMLLYFKYVHEVEAKLKRAVKKDCARTVEKLTQKLANLRKQHECFLQKSCDRDVCGRAFVTFDCLTNKEILKAVYRSPMVKLFPQPAALRFKDCTLKVVNATDPDDILWENQDRRAWPVFLRKCFTVFVTLLLFVALFAVIFSMKTWALRTAEQRDGCLSTGNSDNPLAENWKNLLEQEDRTMLTYCECAELGYIEILLDPTLYQHQCNSFFHRAIAALCAFLLVNIVAEVLLDYLMERLTIMERPLSISSFNWTLCIKLFLAEWISTGVIIPLAASDVLYHIDFFKPLYGATPTLLGYFDADWYIISGQSIILSQSGRALHPHVTMFILYKVMHLVRQCKDDTDAKTPQFDMPLRMACLMTVTALAVGFSAGVPILTIFGSVTFAVVYFIDERMLRFTKMPTGNDQSVFEIFKGFFPLACLLHAGLAIMMFGNRNVFKTSEDTPVDDNSDSVFSIFWSRAMSDVTLSSLCMLIFFLVLYVLGFCKVLNALGNRCVRDYLSREANLPKNTDRICLSKTPKSNLVGLWTYAPENHPTYAPLVAMANACTVETDIKTRRNQAISPIDEPSVYFAR